MIVITIRTMLRERSIAWGTSSFITVFQTRSDGVTASSVTLVPALVGQTINFVTNIPFGVTIHDSIVGSNEICTLIRNFSQAICPVVNDLCADALPLPCNGYYLGTTEGASPDDGCSTFGNNANGVWFVYTPTTETIVSLETCNENTEFDTDLTVFTGDDCDNLECYSGFGNGGYVDGFCQVPGTDVNASQGSFTAYLGQTYYILLSGYEADQIGVYQLDVTCEELGCNSPAVTLTNVNANGEALDGCLNYDEVYYVEASLSGGSGNDNYSVILTGIDTAEVAANGSAILGPVNAGATANVSVTGIEVTGCVTSASTTLPVCPPANDLCANAIPISCGDIVSGSNLGATEDLSCNFDQLRNGVWYIYQPAYNAVVNLETCIDGTNFDTDLSVFTGSCEDLTCFTGFSGDGYIDGVSSCSVQSWAAGGSDATFNAYVGQTYYILLHGFGTADQGFFTLSMSCEEILCTPPNLTLQVVDLNGGSFDGCQPYTTQFNVVASLSGGTGNDTYNVTANGVSQEVAADGSFTFGPYTAGTIVNVNAVGALDGNCTASGTAELEVCPPENDLCADALDLPCNSSYSGNTIGSSPDGPSCATFGDQGGSVWFVATYPTQTVVSLNTCNPGTLLRYRLLRLYR